MKLVLAFRFCISYDKTSVKDLYHVKQTAQSHSDLQSCLACVCENECCEKEIRSGKEATKCPTPFSFT